MELLALELVHYYIGQNKIPSSAAIEAIGKSQSTAVNLLLDLCSVCCGGTCCMGIKLGVHMAEVTQH